MATRGEKKAVQYWRMAARREKRSRYVSILFVLILVGFVVFFSHGYSPVSAFRSAILVPFGHLGDEGPGISDPGKLSLAILMIAEWVVIWMAAESVIDKVVTGRFDEVFLMKSMETRIRKMKSHTIVCGGGRLGREVARRLAVSKLTYVVVDRNPGVVSELYKNGLTIMEGDGTEEAVLLKAGIKRAETLVCAFGKDTDNVFLVLTAKELNPKVRVISRANHEDVVSKLKQAGADEIILPAVIGGKMIFDHIRGK